MKLTYQSLIALIAIVATTTAVNAQDSIEAVDALGADQFGLVYDGDTGGVTTSGPALSTLEIKSANGIFTGTCENVTGLFDVCSADKVFKLEPAGFANLSLGAFMPAGLSGADIAAEISVDGSPASGGAIPGVFGIQGGAAGPPVPMLGAAVASYSNDFSSDDLMGGLLHSNDAATPTVVDGMLRMTEVNVGSAAAALALPTLTGGENGWSAKIAFTLDHTDGGNTPADGFSFNWGDAAGINGLSTIAAEKGYGADVDHVSFQVDTWKWDDEGQDSGFAIAKNGDGSANPDSALVYEPRRGDNAIVQAGGIVTGTLSVGWDPVSGAAMVAELSNGNGVDIRDIAIPGLNTRDDHDDYIFSLATRTGGHTEGLYIDSIEIATGSGLVPPVPEPCSLTLLSLGGLMGLGLVRRRRK